MDSDLLIAIIALVIVIILGVIFIWLYRNTECCSKTLKSLGLARGENYRYYGSSSTDPSSVVTEYDLHGMTKNEAMDTVRTALNGAAPGSTLNIVTGRGLHSSGGVPIIKPAVETYLVENGYSYEWKRQGGMAAVVAH